VYLLKCYSFAILTYACEIWNLSLSEYKTLNVLWNTTSEGVSIVVGERESVLC